MAGDTEPTTSQEGFFNLPETTRLQYDTVNGLSGEIPFQDPTLREVFDRAFNRIWTARLTHGNRLSEAMEPFQKRYEVLPIITYKRAKDGEFITITAFEKPARRVASIAWKKYSDGRKTLQLIKCYRGRPSQSREDAENKVSTFIGNVLLYLPPVG